MLSEMMERAVWMQETTSRLIAKYRILEADISSYRKWGEREESDKPMYLDACPDPFSDRGSSKVEDRGYE